MRERANCPFHALQLPHPHSTAAFRAGNYLTIAITFPLVGRSALP